MVTFYLLIIYILHCLFTLLLLFTLYIIIYILLIIYLLIRLFLLPCGSRKSRADTGAPWSPRDHPVSLPSDPYLVLGASRSQHGYSTLNVMFPSRTKGKDKASRQPNLFTFEIDLKHFPRSFTCWRLLIFHSPAQWHLAIQRCKARWGMQFSPGHTKTLRKIKDLLVKKWGMVLSG